MDVRLVTLLTNAGRSLLEMGERTTNDAWLKTEKVRFQRPSLRQMCRATVRILGRADGFRDRIVVGS